MEGGGCPAPRRLSPASAPRSRRHRGRTSSRSRHEHERALGEQRGAQRERGRRLGHAGLGGPGLPLARLLPRSLRSSSSCSMSFWTPDRQRASSRDWTTRELRRPASPLQPRQRLLEGHADVVRDRRRSPSSACLVFGFPVAYFLAMKVEKLYREPDRPLHHRARPRSGRASSRDPSHGPTR